MVDALKTVEIKTTVGFWDRQLFGTTYTPKDKRCWYEDIKRRHVAGAALLGGTAYELLDSWVFKRGEDVSWWRKFIFPLLMGGAGAGIISTSRSPENIFETDLVSNWISSIIKMVKDNLTKNETFTKLFSPDFKEKITSILEGILSGSFPTIQDALQGPDHEKDEKFEESQKPKDRFEKALQDFLDIQSADDFSLEKLKEIIKQNKISSDDIVYLIRNLLFYYPDTVHNISDGLCTGPLRGQFQEIEQLLNEELFKPNGLTCCIEYDSERQMIDIISYPINAFTHASRPGYHKPCSVISISPPILAAGLYMAANSLKDIDKPGISESEKNKRILGLLIDTLKSTASTVECGKFEVDGQTGEIKEGDEINLVGPLSGFLSYPVLGEMKDLLEELGTSHGRKINIGFKKEDTGAGTLTANEQAEKIRRESLYHTLKAIGLNINPEDTRDEKTVKLKEALVKDDLSGVLKSVNDILQILDLGERDLSEEKNKELLESIIRCAPEDLRASLERSLISLTKRT
ncbi:MAG: hypothetical protein HYY52_04095 [Candidatus Melainabacteria bacterium]|nr:hypothetical protein [Candidatus Melainabacteria bacterium]